MPGSLAALALCAAEAVHGVWVVKGQDIYFCVDVQEGKVCSRFPKEKILRQFPAPAGGKATFKEIEERQQ